MKLRRRTFGLAVLISCALGMQSCTDDEVIPETALPQEAKAFLQNYFPTAAILRVEKEGTNFSVDLTAGLEVDFDKTGSWIAVDAAAGLTIPTGFIKPAIVDYVSKNYVQNAINGIEKEAYGFDVELVKGDIDLIFDKEGVFVREEL